MVQQKPPGAVATGFAPAGTKSAASQILPQPNSGLGVGVSGRPDPVFCRFLFRWSAAVRSVS